MNEVRHSMDDLFLEKLGNHAVDPPMHIWEKIREKRSWRYRFWLQAKRRWYLVVVALLGLALAVLFWPKTQPAETIEIDSLPIPTRASEDYKRSAAVLSEPVTPEPAAKETRSVLSERKPVNPVHKSVSPVQSFGMEALGVDQPEESVAATKPVASDIDRTSASFKSVTPMVSQNGSDAREAIDFPQLPGLQGSGLQTAVPLALAAIPATSTSQYPLEIELYGGVFQPFKRLEAFSDSYLDFLSIREETEEVRPGFSFGTRLSVTLSNGIRLRTGLDFMQINERFDPGKVSLRASGTPIVSEPSQNRLQTIDLPVLIGFEKQMGRISLGINGGAYFNLSFRPSGNILDFTDLEPVSLSAGVSDEQIFKQNIGTSWYGSLNIAYRIAPKLKLSAEPYVRYFPGYFNDPAYVVNQKYLLSGLTLGLRRQIN